MAKTVILANGSFPKKGGAAWKILESARRVVACDGAANAFFRRFHRAPDFIVGDLDSIKVKSKGEKGKSKEFRNPQLFTLHSSLFTLIPDQSTNDLSKAISFCKKQHWGGLVILGATGKREDHSLGNIFRAMEAGVEVVTDCGRFIPCKKKARLRVGKGTAISVFATDKRAKMTSKGLEWPLNGVKFANLYCATLNRSVAQIVEISSNAEFFVYISSRGRSGY